MDFPLLLLLISFSLLDAESNEWIEIEPLFTKEQYERIESFAELKFGPSQPCPCGEDKLDEMTLANFQLFHSGTNEMQLARYLISVGYFEGTFGKVYHATAISYPENKPYKCVAIKMAKERHEINANINISEEDVEKMINTEFDVVTTFREAKHIIGFGPPHFYNISPNGYQTAIVMQIGKDFLDYLTEENGKNYSQETMLKILKQILIGIHEIHQNDFVHLDLKTANILKMPGKEIYMRLIDFGGAIKLENGQSKEIKWEKLTTTPPFEAPEIYEAKKENAPSLTITKKADIWSFGMITLDLLFLILPMNKKEVNLINYCSQKVIVNHLTNHKNKNFQADDKLKKFLEQVENDYPRLLEILKTCLKWKPEERPTAEELLEIYFDGISISTPEEENSQIADFFGEMTKYLDEQFNQISIKLAEEALKTGRLERPSKNNLSANNKIINDGHYGKYYVEHGSQSSRSNKIDDIGTSSSKSMVDRENENTKHQEIELKYLDEENLYLAHQSHLNREGLQKKYTKILERNNKQKQKSPAENVLQNPHKNSQTDNPFFPKVKSHQFKHETGSSSKYAPKNIQENKRTHHRSFSSPQNLITIQRPTFKKRHESIDIHFHRKKSQSHETILIQQPATNTPKLRRSFAHRHNPNLGYSALSPNKSKIKPEKHREISSSSSINENEIQLEEDFDKSKSSSNKSDDGTGTNVLPSRDSSPLHSMERIGRKGFKFVTNIAFGPSNYGKHERKTMK